MAAHGRPHFVLCNLTALALTVCLVSGTLAIHNDFAQTSSPAQLRLQAEQAESRGEWEKACDLYSKLIVRDRTSRELKARYRHCLRRDLLVKRHSDASYRRQVHDLSLNQALLAYAEVLAKLNQNYLDREMVEVWRLYLQGIQELGQACGDETFANQYLSAVAPARITSFRAALTGVWADKPVRKIADVLGVVRDLARAASRELGIPVAVVVMEFAAGACNGLDEYSAYLTPAQYAEIAASWKGEAIGIGVDLGQSDQRVFVSQIVPFGPAHQQGIEPGDRILRIGEQIVGGQTVEQVTELMRGPLNSSLEIELIGLRDTKSRVVRLTRQVIQLPSVGVPRFLDMQLGIGYVQLLGFQDTTLRELDLAINKLQSSGMRAMILDLRGNLGGDFEVAIQVVERFVSAGVIVTTHGQVREYDRLYRAHGTSTLAVPLVVLVDGDTASAAEMVAGAIKENQRGTLVGQTTFGKGTIQKTRRLNTGPGAVRITVAKYLSPTGQALSGVGVSPNLVVDRPLGMTEMELDGQIQAALDVARPLAMGQ